MAYPQTSDFTAPGADPYNPPAWWTYTRDDGTVDVCAGAGGGVLGRARAAVGLPPAGPGWDRAVGAALAARAAALDAAQPGAGWGPLAAALARDAGAPAMPPLAAKFALWLAVYLPAGLRLDAVGLPAGARLPAAGAELDPGAVGGAVVCVDPNRDPLPGVMNAPSLAAAVAQSARGVRVRPGEAGPAYSPTPAGPGGAAGGLPAWAVALLALTAAAGVAAVAVGNARARARPAGARV